MNPPSAPVVLVHGHGFRLSERRIGEGANKRDRGRDHAVAAAEAAIEFTVLFVAGDRELEYVFGAELLIYWIAASDERLGRSN